MNRTGLTDAHVVTERPTPKPIDAPTVFADMTNTPMPLWRPYFAVLAGFLVLDGIWLGMIAGDWYLDAMQPLLRDAFITWPWAAFYLLYGQAVVWLAVQPSVHIPLYHAFVKGAMLGATAYGTYNLTAYSLVKAWPLPITIADWLWGTLATSLLAGLGCWVAKRCMPKG